MSSPAATALVIVVSIALVAGFFLGSRMNRLRARDRANWLRAALRTLGGEPRFSQPGGFGFAATAEHLDGPIRRIDAAALFLPREVPPLWLARSLAGVSDALTLRITLVDAPRFEGDVIDTASAYGRRAARQIPARWTRSREDSLVFAGANQAALTHLVRITAVARDAAFAPQIVSVRKAAPQLLITGTMPDSETAMIATVEHARALIDVIFGRKVSKPAEA